MTILYLAYILYFFYAYSHILNIQIDDKLVKFTDTSILKFYIFLYINNTLIVGRLRIDGFSREWVDCELIQSAREHPVPGGSFRAWADCEPIYRHLSSILQIFFQGQKWLRCFKKFGVFCLFFRTSQAWTRNELLASRICNLGRQLEFSRPESWYFVFFGRESNSRRPSPLYLGRQLEFSRPRCLFIKKHRLFSYYSQRLNKYTLLYDQKNSLHIKYEGCFVLESLFYLKNWIKYCRKRLFQRILLRHLNVLQFLIIGCI